MSGLTEPTPAPSRSGHDWTDRTNRDPEGDPGMSALTEPTPTPEAIRA